MVGGRTYYSISEASRMLGVSRPTIYARIKSGDLLAVQVSPKTIRIWKSRARVTPCAAGA